jgi:hypothetical protein
MADITYTVTEPVRCVVSWRYVVTKLQEKRGKEKADNPGLQGLGRLVRNELGDQKTEKKVAYYTITHVLCRKVGEPWS